MKKKDKSTRTVKTVVLSVTVAVALLGMLAFTVGRQEFSFPHKLALEIIGTFQYGATAAGNTAGGWWKSYLALWGLREENRRLSEELQKLRAAANEYREAAATNIRLKKLLQMKETLPSPTMAADVIGHDPSLWFKTLIVNRGASDGVKKGMPVMAAEGVVGQVINTSPHYSKVLLATDPNSAIDVLVQKSRVQGILKGNGSGFLLHYVLKNSDVEEGDSIVTSGFGGSFPKGLPMGTVKRIVRTPHGMFQQIEVEPAVNFTLLEDVIIVLREASLTE